MLLSNFTTQSMEALGSSGGGSGGSGAGAKIYDPHAATRVHRPIESTPPEFEATVLPMVAEALHPDGFQENGRHCTAARSYVEKTHRPKLQKAHDNRKIAHGLLHREWPVVVAHLKHRQAREAAAGGLDGLGDGTDDVVVDPILQGLYDKVATFSTSGELQHARCVTLRSKIVDLRMQGGLDMTRKDVGSDTGASWARVEDRWRVVDRLVAGGLSQGRPCSHPRP